MHPQETNGRTAIINAKIVMEAKVVDSGALVMENGAIRSISPMEAFRSSAFPGEIVDAEGAWLLPGFIDLHIHGGGGSDFMDGSFEAIDAVTRFHASGGTTTLLATTVTASRERLEQVLSTVDRYVRQPEGMPYAAVAGVHLEGPFLSPVYPGAQQAEYMVPPNREWLADWIARYPGLLRLVTLAPEQEGALECIGLLARQGIRAACGHTDADYDRMILAAGVGLSHAAHTFNAMRGLHHREPGVVGAVMADSRIVAEIIGDGRHVHPACIRLLYRLKGPTGLALVTDAMSAAGLGDGSYQLGELSVTVSGGTARLTQGGALAGSTLTMLDAFRHAVREVGIPIPHASRMASLTPAAQLGLQKSKGSLLPGKAADLLLLTPELALRQVWIAGKPYGIPH